MGTHSGRLCELNLALVSGEQQRPDPRLRHLSRHPCGLIRRRHPRAAPVLPGPTQRPGPRSARGSTRLTLGCARLSPLPPGAALSQACRGHRAIPGKIPNLLNKAVPVPLCSFLPFCTSLCPLLPGQLLTHWCIQLPTPLAPLPVAPLTKLGPPGHALPGEESRGHAHRPFQQSLGRWHHLLTQAPIPRSPEGSLGRAP